VRHDHQRLQPGDGVVSDKVPLDETPARGGEVVLRPRVVWREGGVVQRPHGEDDEQQRELLRVDFGVPVQAVRARKDGLHARARRDVVVPRIVAVVCVEEDPCLRDGREVEEDGRHGRRGSPRREGEEGGGERERERRGPTSELRSHSVPAVGPSHLLRPERSITRVP
jgi:hypothetical protein